MKQQHHKEKQKSVVCPYCQKSFRPDNLKKHFISCGQKAKANIFNHLQDEDIDMEEQDDPEPVEEEAISMTEAMDTKKDTNVTFQNMKKW